MKYYICKAETITKETLLSWNYIPVYYIDVYRCTTVKWGAQSNHSILNNVLMTHFLLFNNKDNNKCNEVYVSLIAIISYNDIRAFSETLCISILNYTNI